MLAEYRIQDLSNEYSWRVKVLNWSIYLRYKNIGLFNAFFVSPSKISRIEIEGIAESYRFAG